MWNSRGTQEILVPTSLPGVACVPPGPKRVHSPTMHFETHQNVIDDLEARILTIRDSL